MICILRIKTTTKPFFLLRIDIIPSSVIISFYKSSYNAHSSEQQRLGVDSLLQFLFEPAETQRNGVGVYTAFR